MAEIKDTIISELFVKLCKIHETLQTHPLLLIQPIWDIRYVEM